MLPLRFQAALIAPYDELIPPPTAAVTTLIARRRSRAEDVDYALHVLVTTDPALREIYGPVAVACETSVGLDGVCIVGSKALRKMGLSIADALCSIAGAVRDGKLDELKRDALRVIAERRRIRLGPVRRGKSSVCGNRPAVCLPGTAEVWGDRLEFDGGGVKGGEYKVVVCCEGGSRASCRVVISEGGETWSAEWYLDDYAVNPLTFVAMYADAASRTSMKPGSLPDDLHKATEKLVKLLSCISPNFIDAKRWPEKEGADLHAMREALFTMIYFEHLIEVDVDNSRILAFGAYRRRPVAGPYVVIGMGEYYALLLDDEGRVAGGIEVRFPYLLADDLVRLDEAPARLLRRGAISFDRDRAGAMLASTLPPDELCERYPRVVADLIFLS